MKINTFTNLAFRVLIYLALRRNQTVKTGDIAKSYGVSYNHLKKVITLLIEHEYILATKGRGGGIRLALEANAINIGKVFRLTIEDVALAECFASPSNKCVISPTCRLRTILQDATSIFIAELDKYTLSDLVEGRENALANHLAIDVIELK
ncbi:Rrf2 family transcriptional regulator [Alteromonas sp. 14N.309.X.WAT.G.H12]|uniref:RrF2 family transcriptional regulator n=1 Tax=Alteromonas sp. 14N.309.X.WAT.G.H12 TaxID=3120824 RepID=UPI002FD60D79